MPPKIFYSSATVLVLMFFKLNSLSAFIFYLTVANLKQVLEFVKFSVPLKNVLLQCDYFSSDVYQIKQSLCFYFLFLQQQTRNKTAGICQIQCAT